MAGGGGPGPGPGPGPGAGIEVEAVEINQTTETFAYLRYISGDTVTATLIEVEQTTETFAYLKYISGETVTATPIEVEQTTETFAKLKYISGDTALRSPNIIVQRSNISAILFYRPFIASSAELLPLLQVTPAFGALPQTSLDGMPLKSNISSAGNQPQTKLITAETFPFGTNLQGVPREDIVKPWGKLYIAIENQDITLFRNSDVIINAISWSSLGNYETIEITVPAATSYDDITTIPWLYNGATLDVWKEYEVEGFLFYDILWRGTINGWAFEGGGLGLKITAHGLLYDLTYQIARPEKDFIVDRDAGYYITKTVNEGKGLYNKATERITGTTTNTTGNYETNIEYLRKITDESQTTVWLNEFNIPLIIKRDERETWSDRTHNVPAFPNKTIKYINGQDGLVDSLAFDQTSESTIEYGTGRYPVGGDWANWVYPQVENQVDALMYALVTGGIIDPFTPSFPLGFPLADINASIKPGMTDSETMIISSFPSSVDPEFPVINVASIDSAKNGNGITTMYYAIQWWKSIKDYGRGWGNIPGVGGSDPNFRPYPNIENNKGTYTDDLIPLIKEIQADNGLLQTGDVDIKTWSAIFRLTDISSDAWIAPIRAQIHPSRTRLIEKHIDLGISQISHKYPKGFTQEEFLRIYKENQTPAFYGDAQIWDYNPIVPLWVGEVELTLCPPIVENRDDFGNGEVSRFDIKPRDILQIWFHPGSWKEGFLETDRFNELFITRVEWNLANEPTVKLQLSTIPFEYSKLYKYINQDLD